VRIGIAEGAEAQGAASGRLSVQQFLPVVDIRHILMPLGNMISCQK
jgi:hypothetical protein